MLLNTDHYLDLNDGVFDATTKSDLDHLFANLKTAPGRDKLVVHFHGGLVDKQSGLNAAELVMEHYQNLNAYQVFFIWESGLLDALSQKLRAIFDEPIFQQLLLYINQFTASLSRDRPLQEAEKVQFGQMLKASSILPTAAQAVALGPNIEKATGVVERVTSRFAEGRDHGLYATVVEELLRQFYLYRVGKDIWDHMKQETIDAFGNDASRYGGTAFLQGLKAYWESGQQPHITLVGHSAGAIYICRFLQYADLLLPEDMKFDLVFLAPACTFELFSQTLKNYAQRITGIRVFGMRDELEQADPLVPSVPLIYPYSLLYFISGVLEDVADTPLVGMQRYYFGKAPYNAMPEVVQSLNYLSAPGTQRTVWSVVNAGPGLASNVTTHGGFYSDVATLDSLQYIILNRLP